MSKPISSADVDVVVVGAGFAGLYALRKLRDTMKLSTRVFEAGSDVGGTWFWNRYPGARCDIESVHYSYSFYEDLQQEWQWSEKFAGQPEILRYLEHVADRFDLRKDITFDTRVVGVHWDDENSVWTVRTDDGAVVRSRYFISGAGNLSVPKTPEFGGIDGFRGEVLLTGNWPREGVDFTGKRVAVIGTGASGIQVIPFIAEEAAELAVFQRTPNFATPSATARSTRTRWRISRANYADVRNAARNHFLGVPFTQAQPSALAVDAEERRATFDERWNAGGFRSVHRLLPGHPVRQGGQRHDRRLHPRPDPRARAGSGEGRDAGADGLRVRHQAPAARDQLLRGVQPRLGQRSST